MQELQNRLVVRTFGAFSVSWNGTLLFDDAVSGETQFNCLMQMLLHHRREGVDRTQLMEELFYDRDVQDAAHSMSVLFYNAQKKLRALGLPAVSYFEKRNARVYWTSMIPVQEDTDRLEALCRAADAAPEGDGAQLALYLEASRCYQGDFLPSRAGSLWVSYEARRYRELFGTCVRKAAALLREQGDFERLEELGRHAARVQPYCDWEQLTLEALIAQGRAEEAKRSYRETEQRYFQELKLRPDPRMIALRSRIEALDPPGHQQLDTIQTLLADSDSRDGGAYFCAYSIFENLYHAAQRRAKRSGRPACLMLCALEKGEGQQSAQSESFRQALCGALRRSDSVCQYGQLQYLVLLADTAPEACAAVQARVNARLSPAQRAAVQYDVKMI